ncbi:MAG: hypothetical protein J6V47_05535 [Bacteroidaceae bacterium]|nr:hypothetical protein [Bacteroidaceae bacterium]
MNKEKQQVYNEVLAGVLDRFGLTEERMFRCNCSECVEARTSLVMTLTGMGFSDRDIAELTNKMRRCSVCLIRNKYIEENAPWTVRHCIDALKNRGCGR